VQSYAFFAKPQNNPPEMFAVLGKMIIQIPKSPKANIAETKEFISVSAVFVLEICSNRFFLLPLQQFSTIISTKG
jgi:hypothetical protein